MILSGQLPMKRIMIRGELYLERYHIKNDEDGIQHWLHRFLRNDAEEHMHSHPWHAVSTVLCGQYTEDVMLTNKTVIDNFFQAGDINYIPKNKIHRIVDVQPNTWTYMRVRPERLPTWFFIDESGEKVEMNTSPVDWYKDCKTRLQQNSTD
jgi:quercetin dioxygenase-like cupin family protein